MSSRNAPLRVKLNGICDPQSLAAALNGGADFIGFHLAPHPSLRIAPQLAGQLTASMPSATQLVGIFRDPGDAEIEDALSHMPLDYIQLNGNEPPARVHDIRQQFGLPLIKSLAVSSAGDLAGAPSYAQAVDYLLLTARAPANVLTLHTAPDNQIDCPFDWSLLAGRTFHRPWFLGGGITAANLSAALLATGASHIDVTGGIMGKNHRADPVLVTEILGKSRDLSPILAPTILE